MAIDKKDFASIRTELDNSEEKRDALMQESREIIKLSKYIIYAIHRDDLKKAESLSKKITAKTKKLDNYENLTGMKHVAQQEYVEAIALLNYAKSKKIPARKTFGVPTESYLSGIADLSGELVRMAVNFAINKNDKEVMKIKDVVEEIYGEFLQLNLRNGELRKKSDQIKWSLNKLEGMAYDISKR